MSIYRITKNITHAKLDRNQLELYKIHTYAEDIFVSVNLLAIRYNKTIAVFERSLRGASVILKKQLYNDSINCSLLITHNEKYLLYAYGVNAIRVCNLETAKHNDVRLDKYINEITWIKQIGELIMVFGSKMKALIYIIIQNSSTKVPKVKVELIHIDNELPNFTFIEYHPELDVTLVKYNKNLYTTHDFKTFTLCKLDLGKYTRYNLELKGFSPFNNDWFLFYRRNEITSIYVAKVQIKNNVANISHMEILNSKYSIINSNNYSNVASKITFNFETNSLGLINKERVYISKPCLSDKLAFLCCCLSK